jgi:NADP-dependent aldehyde dehydrogenase
MLSKSIFNLYQHNIKNIATHSEIKTTGKGNAAEKQNAADPYMFSVSAETFLQHKELQEEIFGPASIHVTAKDENELIKIVESLQGQLTITIWGTENDISNYTELLNYLELKAGRIIINGIPTGVEVTHAMMHGGPYPATTDSKFTSVGSTSIYRFTRPVCYQNFGDRFLPEALQNKNPLNIVRMINGGYTKNEVE